jgi:hypothetical protein
MAKDAKGHGSEKSNWSHKQWADHGMGLHKEAARLRKAGQSRAATDARAAANEAMTMAVHLRKREERVAKGATPAQKMQGVRSTTHKKY